MSRRRSFVPACAWGAWLAAILVGPRGFAAPPPAEPRPAIDLSTAFRFSERYATTEERPRPEVIGPYRVAIREAIKESVERPQGAPEQGQTTVQTIYAERAAQVSATGAVLASVRRFEAFRLVPDPSTRPSARRPLEGLTIWYQPKPNDAPLILNLSENRPLRANEYAVASRQTFVPELMALLPSLPSRVGDRWNVSKFGVRALLGEPAVGGEPLSANLIQVRPAAPGENLEAEVGITGRALLVRGPTTVNARLRFSFPAPPPAADPASGKPRGDEAIVDARGAVVELRMAAVTTIPVGPNGRLRKTTTWETILARQLGSQGAPLPVPEAPPTVTEANSWVTYDDPQGRFHFRYPQSLHPDGPPLPDSIALVDVRPGRRDSLRFDLLSKTGDADVDRQNRDPESHLKTLKELWAQERRQMRLGNPGWLPESAWAASKMKAYRVDAVSTELDPSTKRKLRVYFDFYLILFGRDEGLTVQAETLQEPPTAFRKQTESVIKSFQFGPSESRP